MASTDPGDNPPNWCFKTNAQGDLPTCSYYGGEWHRTYEGSGDGGGGGIFALLFVLALVVAAGTTWWRVSTARSMARRSGLDEGQATRMALMSDDGLEATYLASALRQPAPPAPAPTPAAPGPAPERGDVAERLRRLDSLREQELVSTEEWAERRRAILDEL